MQKFQHGDPVVTSEPCLNCTCKKGVLLCFLRVCPSLILQHYGEDCVTTREPGQCCPTVKCRPPPPTMSTDSTETGLDDNDTNNNLFNSTESSRTTQPVYVPDSSNWLASGESCFQFPFPVAKFVNSF